MEAAMAEVIAPADRDSDVQIPQVLRWWDSGTWAAFEASVDALAVTSTTPAQVPTRTDPRPGGIPELVLGETPKDADDGAFAGRRALEEEVAQLRRTLDELGVTERDQLWMEVVDLNSQIPAMRHEREQLRIEVVDLNSQLPAMRHEREELLAAVAPLRAEVTDLRSKQQELASIRSEIRQLRHQKSALDRELLAELRSSTEESGRARNRHRFHDS
jgi:cell division protein FtsL